MPACASVSFHYSALNNDVSADALWSVLPANTLLITVINTGKSGIQTLDFNNAGAFTGLKYLSGASPTIKSNQSSGGQGIFDWSLTFNGSGLNSGLSTILLQMSGVGSKTSRQIENGIATDLSTGGQHTAIHYTGSSDGWTAGTQSTMAPEGTSLALLAAGLVPLLGGLLCSRRGRVPR
jgi:hypothetical protein